MSAGVGSSADWPNGAVGRTGAVWKGWFSFLERFGWRKTCNMKVENLKLEDGLMFDNGCNVKDRKIGVGLFRLWYHIK